MQITSRMRNYVKRKLRCPAAVEDVLQEVAISAWQTACEDVALLWRIVRCRTVDHQRKAVRRESRVVSHCDQEVMDLLDDSSASDDTPDVEPLLQFAGPYRADVELWMAGDAKSAVERKRASRGIARIRREVAQ